MTANESKSLSQVGVAKKTLGAEVFYLAPLPVPTGTAAFSSRHLLKNITETFMDFGSGNGTLEFGTRALIGSVMAVIILFIITSIPVTYTEIKFNDENYLKHLLAVLLNPYFWAFIAALTLIYSFVFIKAVRKLVNVSPIRFNRQRREVAYVAKRGRPPRFVPWEEVIACVSSGKVITQYGTHNSFSLMIGLRDAESGDVVWITVPTASLMLAISEWEAIRGYMEEGLSALPQPMSEEYEEGTVAYFQLCRQAYRENHWYVTYLFGFILIQFCSGWTLPCHIAAWVERLPKTSFPKSVLDWSKPLPPEQWQKPSAELIEQSKAVRKSLRQGKSVFDHFHELNATSVDVQQVEIPKRANS